MVLTHTARALRLLPLALAALAAAPAAAQQAAAPAAPGWIGLFAEMEQEGASPPVVVVLAVAAGSPAARAGVAAGDTLLAVGGAPLTGERLKALPTDLRAGDRVELTLRRAGGSRTLQIRAEARPAPPAPPAAAHREPLEAPVAVQHRVFVRPAEPVEAAPALPEPEVGTPFTLHVFGDAQTDSLIAALKAGEKRLVQARSAESVRLRELAARVGSGGRVDARDAALVEIRRRKDAVAAEVARLRATLAAMVEERSHPTLLTFSGQAEGQPPAVAPRPMTPYIAGRDRVAGARVTPLNEGLAEYFGSAQGLLVVEVTAGTPAAAAGLRAGDVLLRVGAADVGGLDALRRAVAEAPADRPVGSPGTELEFAL